MDLNGLQSQINEKKRLKQIEQERDNQFNAEDVRRAEVIRKKHEELERERRRIETEINEYRQKFQQRKDTREFDLNDPKGLQKSVAARMGDHDQRLSISSAQKYK